MVPCTPHNVWTGKQPRDNRCAIIKPRFLTGCYMLQTTKALLGDKEVLCPCVKMHRKPESTSLLNAMYLKTSGGQLWHRSEITSPLHSYVTEQYCKSRITHTTNFRSPIHPIERKYNLQEICAAWDGNLDQTFMQQNALQKSTARRLATGIWIWIWN